MTYFQTKLRPEDFIVTELLPEEPLGQGDFHYILFEKKGMTTFLLIDLLINEFSFNKNMIGIAGLKDKNAMTKQRLSFSKRDVVKYCGGINTLLAWLRKKGRVVKATYGDHMLKLGENTGNRFDLVLTPQKPITDTIRQYVEQILPQLAAQGVPNFFGEQRFGHGGTNWKIGHELLAGTIRNIKGDKNTLAEKRFKVQAFASYVFNQYLIERQKKGLLYTQIAGDIFSKDTRIVTGPVPGDDLALAGQDAATLEQAVFSKVGLSQQLMNRFKVFGLYGIRRPILLFPQKLTYKRGARGTLCLSFSLSSGAYATVVLDELENKLATLTGQVKNKSINDKNYNKNTVIDAKKYKGNANKSRTETEAKKPSQKQSSSPKMPGINPYTGQKLNPSKQKEKMKQKVRTANKSTVKKPKYKSKKGS